MGEAGNCLWWTGLADSAPCCGPGANRRLVLVQLLQTQPFSARSNLKSRCPPPPPLFLTQSCSPKPTQTTTPLRTVVLRRLRFCGLHVELPRQRGQYPSRLTLRLRVSALTSFSTRLSTLVKPTAILTLPILKVRVLHSATRLAFCPRTSKRQPAQALCLRQTALSIKTRRTTVASTAVPRVPFSQRLNSGTLSRRLRLLVVRS